MKKIIALLLVVCTVVCFAACSKKTDDPENTKETVEVKKPDATKAPEATEETKAPETTEATKAPEATEETKAPEATEAPNTTDGTEGTEATKPAETKVMTHAEYAAAELDTDVVVETYVQAAQGWWEKDGKGVITVYCQSPDGAYFAYEMSCTKEDAEKLVPGTKIRITGVKGEWAGEVEIIDCTFEFVAGDTFIAEAFDATALLGTEDLIKHQNEKVTFKGLTFEKLEYQNGEPGKDIYVTFKLADKEYSFCVESYLTAPDSDLYKAVGELKTGDVVDVEGFLYWYEGANPHITNITKK